MLTGVNVYDGWPPCFDMENTIFQTIRDELRTVGQKICPDLIKSLVSSVGAHNAFHPVRDYLESLAWDGRDRIPMILDALGIDPQAFEATMIIKWMLQAVASAYNDGRRSFEHVLVLVGPQGCGKTTFFRMLVPPAYRTEWFREGRSINMEDKDSVRIATSGWITELGEADSTLQREQAALKAFLSSTNDTYRVPFAVKPLTRPRWTVFGATVNSDIYLNDQTGNRRWWSIRVDHMDVTKVHALAAHINQIWAQFKSIWDTAALNGKEWSCFRLTDEESCELEALNAAHTSIDPLLMLIKESFDWNARKEAWTNKTSKEIYEPLQVTDFHKRKFFNILREELQRRGLEATRPANRETWRLPPFKQSVTRSYLR